MNFKQNQYLTRRAKNRLFCIADIKEKIKIKQEEITEFDLRTLDNGQPIWKKSDKIFEYKFTELEKEQVLITLKKLHDEEKLLDSLLPLCKLFGFKGEKKE